MAGFVGVAAIIYDFISTAAPRKEARSGAEKAFVINRFLDYARLGVLRSK